MILERVELKEALRRAKHGTVSPEMHFNAAQAAALATGTKVEQRTFKRNGVNGSFGLASNMLRHSNCQVRRKPAVKAVCSD